MKTENEKPRSPRKPKAPVIASRDWSAEQREQIAALAYQRFLARGGEHGYAIEDWLAAEAELAASLAGVKARRAQRTPQRAASRVPPKAPQDIAQQAKA